MRGKVVQEASNLFCSVSVAVACSPEMEFIATMAVELIALA